MPKGKKHVNEGGEFFWFDCGCGYRWSGGTQTAKTMAFRLHEKKCYIAKACTRDVVNNTSKAWHSLETAGSKDQAVEKHLKKMGL